MVDKEEVTLIVYDIWEQVRCRDWGRVLPIPAPTWMITCLCTGLSPGAKAHPGMLIMARGCDTHC